MNFEEAFKILIGHEGGYANDSRDPGMETKYGISKRAHPTEDIAGMTLERAKQIYRRDYWGPAGCDAVPGEMKFQVFDVAVNAGVKRAIEFVQASVHEVVDGILGPKTLQAIQSMPEARLLARFNGYRLEHMATLPQWPAFGRGWANRVAQNLKRA